MLGVVDDFLAMLLEKAHSLGDQLEVLPFGDSQGTPGVQLPALAENGNHGRAGLDQSQNAGIGLYCISCRASRAERSQLRMTKLQIPCLDKKFLVLGVGAGPAAFNVVNAEFIQHLRDKELVFQGDGNGLALAPIAKRGIKSKDLHTAVCKTNYFYSLRS